MSRRSVIRLSPIGDRGWPSRQNEVLELRGAESAMELGAQWSDSGTRTSYGEIFSRRES